MLNLCSLPLTEIGWWPVGHAENMSSSINSLSGSLNSSTGKGAPVQRRSSNTSQASNSTGSNSAHNHHNCSASLSSLTNGDEYGGVGDGSSRYSSLHDTESIKSAILDSFRMHWLQAWTIMQNHARTEKIGKKTIKQVSFDDLSSIINHLEQMISLLIEDGNSASSGSAIGNSTNSVNQLSGQFHDVNDFDHPLSSLPPSGSAATTNSNNKLFHFMFSEAILDKIYEWSQTWASDWKFAMMLEQLKLYELLISQVSAGHDQLASLFQPSFLRPLLHLLNDLATQLTCPNGTPFMGGGHNALEIEKRLVLLLNTLCVAISHNPNLMESFWIGDSCVSTVCSSQSSANSSSNNDDSLLSSSLLYCDNLSSLSTASSSNATTPTTGRTGNFTSSSQLTPLATSTDPNHFTFPIFTILTQFVHRIGPIGQQSRDALLLCLSLSNNDERLAYYIVTKTDFVPLLATGLSGLFSSLPRVIIGQAMSAEQFQFKDDLMHDSREIEQFLRCLDFCNAVAQMSHPVIQIQMLNFIYNGFLVSVIGPALHQVGSSRWFAF